MKNFQLFHFTFPPRFLPGYDPDKIFVYPDLDEATASLFSTKGDKFAIANYTAIQPTRAAIKKYKSLKENGEEK